MDNDPPSAPYGRSPAPITPTQSCSTEDAQMDSRETDYHQHSFSTSVTSSLSGALEMGTEDSQHSHHGYNTHDMQWSDEGWPVGSLLRAEAPAGSYQVWPGTGRIEGSDLDWSFLSTSVSQDDAGWFVPASQPSSTVLSASAAGPSSQSSSALSHSFESRAPSSMYDPSTASVGDALASPTHPRESSLSFQDATFTPRSPTSSTMLSPAASSHTLVGPSTSSSPCQGLRQPASPIDVFSEQYSTFSFSDMDWDNFVQGYSRLADLQPHSHNAAGSSMENAFPSHSSTSSSSSALPSSKQPTTMHRLENLPEEESHSHEHSGGGSELDFSRQRSQQVHTPDPKSTLASRKPPGPRSSLGMTLSHLRQKSSRQAASDVSSVRQVYSTSHGRVGLDARAHMSGNSVSSHGESTSRRRAGTLEIAQPSKSDEASHQRLASSVPDPDRTPLASNFCERVQRRDANEGDSSFVHGNRRSAHDLPASITADFESLGLDLAQYTGGVQDVTMGDMYGDGVELLKPCEQGSFRESSIGTADASFASTSSSTLESSGLEDSFLAPGVSQRRSWTEEGTPLSSPAFSAHLQLYPSPGPSRYSSFSSSYQKTSGPADKGKGRASEFGVLARQPSSIASWPHCGDQSSQACLQNAARASTVSGVTQDPEHFGRGQLSSTADHSSARTGQGSHLRSRTEMQACRSVDALQEDRKKADHRLGVRTHERPSSMGSMKASRSAMKPSALPLASLGQSEVHQRHSTTTSGKPNASPFTSHRAGGKRVDYDEVSEALDTLRKFLQQRDSARKDDAQMNLPASLPTDNFTPRNRTLRHAIGKLPPRGSVRLDATSSASAHGSVRGHQSHRRQHASFLSTSDEHAREQDRLDAVQHLSERVRVLRQRSQRFQSGGAAADEPRQQVEHRRRGTESTIEHTGHQYPTKEWSGGSHT